MKLKLHIKIMLCVCIGTMNGQTNQDTITKLKVVVIKGRQKTPKERGEFKRHAQPVEALTDQDLKRNNPAFIEQSLGIMAGVQVDKRTQLGGQRIVIRGYGNDQKFNNWGIKIYYNMFPLTDAEGVTTLDDVDFSNVNNIEVVKGPAATMYGGGVGGVVRFYFKANDYKGITIAQNTAVGSFGLLQSNTRMDYNTDKINSFLSYSHLESNGYRPHGESLKNFFTYKGDFKVNEKESIGVFLSHNMSHEGISGQISYSDYYDGIDNGNAAYIKKNAHLDYLTTRFAINNNVKFTKNFTNMTNLFYSNSEIESVSAGTYQTSSKPNYSIRSVFTLTNSFASKVENVLNVGTEIQQSQLLNSNFRFTGINDNIPLQVNNIADGQYLKWITNQQSYFIHNRLNFKTINASLILGLSANSISYQRKDLLALPNLIINNTKDISFDKRFTTVFNPHIAIQKSIKDQIFNLSYSEGYNAPIGSASYIAALGIVNDNLVPEKARMFDLSAQGLLFKTRLDYQISVFNIDVSNKLTNLGAFSPYGIPYTYTDNTGDQRNRGVEASVGYVYDGETNDFITKVTPFVNVSYYNFKYRDFKTIVNSVLTDFTDKRVVGVPQTKYALGLDLVTKLNIYVNTTFNFLSNVFSDFANTNYVKSYGLLNAKIGYKFISKNKKFEIEIFEAGNNLTNQINYTFLFLGSNINDVDTGSGYAAGVKTDVNPGPTKAYFWSGINLKYKL